MGKCLKGESEVEGKAAKYVCANCGALTAVKEHVCKPEKPGRAGGQPADSKKTRRDGGGKRKQKAPTTAESCVEIERKFLLRNASWKEGAEGVRYRQGYLCLDPERSVRVRIAGKRGVLTIKGAGDGPQRAEFEYEIPVKEARKLLDTLCLRPQIDKIRYRIRYADHLWEVDEFRGENRGLVLAEVELQRPDEKVKLPPWVGEEVTGDKRYFNAYLVRHPFRSWSKKRA